MDPPIIPPRSMGAAFSNPEIGMRGWKNRPSYSSSGGKYIENLVSVPSNPPCTYR